MPGGDVYIFPALWKGPDCVSGLRQVGGLLDVTQQGKDRPD